MPGNGWLPLLGSLRVIGVALQALAPETERPDVMVLKSPFSIAGVGMKLKFWLGLDRMMLP